MKVIELYIMRRAAMIFVGTLLCVMAIVWTTQVLARINVVTTSGESAATFFQIAWLVLPAVIPVIMPFAVGIAVAHTLTTMNTDSELVVLSAAGSPRMTVYRPILIIALIACVTSFLTHNFVEPYARQALRNVLAESRADLISTVIREGTFQKIDDGLYIQIGERLPDGGYAGIFVADRRDENVELIYYAQTGATLEVDNRHILVMQDGVVHRRNASGDVSVVNYQSYAFDLSEFTPAEDGDVTLFAKDRTLANLWEADPNDPVYKGRPQRLRAELHRRLSEWLYPMVFALIGLAVAGDARSYREARFHPLITTMGIALVVRWAGYYASGVNEDHRAFSYVVYGIPVAASAIAIYFIATNRVMELPSSVHERVMSAWKAMAERMSLLRLRLNGSRGSA